MVSPENPNPTVGPEVTGRGFVAGEVRTEPVTGVQGLVLYRSRISWGAVIAGTLLSLALLLLSSSLAYTVGVPAYAGGAFGAGAFIWACVTAAIAFFCGGCLSAYLVPTEDRRFDMLHGVMTWALALPLILAIHFVDVGLINRTGMFVSQTQGNALNMGLTVAAWGIFIAQLIGLIFAAIGGQVANLIDRRSRLVVHR